jgi:mannose-6-phosphate isomerase
LDATELLSVQVHPSDAIAAKLTPPDLGKTEAWVVLETATEGVVYAGLKPGINRDRLAEAIRRGDCQECLHHFHPAPGDCIFLPAGTVHTVGKGVLVAEIQQSSDATFRLFDWNRVGADGRPRPLHVEQALDAIDYGRGPVAPQPLRPAERPEVGRLVECEQFVLNRCDFSESFVLGGDGRCHIVVVLQEAIEIEGDPAARVLPRGGTVLIPACLGPVRLSPRGYAGILDAYLP